MANFARFFIFALIFAAIQGCVTTGGGFQNPLSQSSDSKTRWVAAFLPFQNPVVDTLAAGKSEDEYTMPIWREYEAGRVPGVISSADIFLWTGSHVRPLGTHEVSGHKNLPVSISWVSQSTMLCVTVPWEIIAHQTMAADDKTDCTQPGALYEYFYLKGRGLTPEDSYGVIAIAPGSVGLPTTWDEKNQIQTQSQMRTDFGTGKLRPSGDFDWMCGGGDSYDGTPEEAFARTGMDPFMQQYAAAYIRDPRNRPQIFQITDGFVMGAMVSGKGKDSWVAERAIAHPSSNCWKKDVSGKPITEARVWYITDPRNGEQYRVMDPKVCNNWSVVRYGTPLRCPCRPGKDACA